MKEKTADEMFEEIGYEKVVESEFKEPDNDEITEIILYRNDILLVEISFWNDKTIGKTREYDNSYITAQELKAIYKKCEELKWN